MRYVIEKSAGLGNNFVAYQVEDGQKGMSYEYANALARRITAAFQALENSLDIMEYIQRNNPEVTGYGVLDQRIQEAKAILRRED